MEWHPLDIIKDEDPHSTANYIIGNDLGTISNMTHGRWNRLFLRSIKRKMRRLRRSDFFGFEASTFNPSSTSKKRRSRRYAQNNGVSASTSHKTPTTKRSRNFKFGLEVPKSWRDIMRIDDESGNRHWQDAVAKEIAALIHHKCFDFKSPDFKPSREYHYVRLHLLYNDKPDLTPKARLVCDGSQVDPRDLSTRATLVKGISVRLLYIIADSQNLKALTGDIGNAFIQAHTKEKIYTRCGPEFGDREHSIAVIVRALYDLTTSAERFRTMLANFLRTLGFVPSRYDRDVWMRLRNNKTGYDYICTHVDDFKVVAKKPSYWIDHIASAS